MKTPYEEELEQRLAALENNYGYLKAKLDELEGVAELEQKLVGLRDKLDEIKGRGEGALGEVKDRAEKAWREAESALEKVKQRLAGK